MTVEPPKSLWDVKQRQGNALHRICSQCQRSIRLRARGLCGACYERERLADPKNRDKRRAKERRRYAANPGKFKAKSAAYASKNVESCKASQRAWRAANREQCLWVHARKRASRDGLEFTITVDDVFIPEVCPALGIRLDRDADMSRRPSAPSLDRIDSSKGYVPGNVWVISHRANVIKNDATPDELMRIAAAVRRVLGTGA